MTRKSIYIAVFICGVFFAACGDEKKETTSSTTETPAAGASGGDNSTASTDPKGVGPHKNVQLTSPLDEAMVTKGKQISDVKCTSCHKMDSEKLVGPGWAGVTDRRTPEWIMNFITNTDEMLARDTAVQNMLEVCLVKMPNQGLSDTDARSVLEFMRKNDGKK